jgi:hypothetical protein
MVLFSPLSSFFLGSLLFSQKEVSYGFEILHGLLSNKHIRIPTKKKLGDPPLPSDYGIFGGTHFEKLS